MRTLQLLAISILLAFPSFGLEARCTAKLRPGVPPEALAQEPPPGISWTISTLEWNAPEADLVLLPGLAEETQAPIGEKEAWAPAVFTVVAIVKGKAEAIFVRCEPGALPGPSPGEPVLPISFVYSARATHQRAFASPAALKDVVRTLLATLQEEGFVPLAAQWSQNNTYAQEEAHHTELSAHNLLCSGEECSVPLTKRSIEREAMFTARVVPTTVEGKAGFEVFLQPLVVQRRRREGGAWSLDPQGASIAGDLCKHIGEKLVRSFK